MDSHVYGTASTRTVTRLPAGIIPVTRPRARKTAVRGQGIRAWNQCAPISITTRPAALRAAWTANGMTRHATAMAAGIITMTATAMQPLNVSGKIIQALAGARR